VQTFDLHFFRITKTVLEPNLIDSTNFQLTCDPFRVVEDPISLTCDYSNWLQTPGLIGPWTTGADGNPMFLTGNWAD